MFPSQAEPPARWHCGTCQGHPEGTQLGPACPVSPGPWGAAQSLTWQGQEFLQLCFQPADLLTELDVVHPAGTQTEPLRGKLGEKRFQTPRAAPSQCLCWGSQLSLPSLGKCQPTSSVLLGQKESFITFMITKPYQNLAHPAGRS